MPKQPPQTEWEKRARVALSEGDALTTLRILEAAPLHATLQPGFPYLYAQALAQMGQSRMARPVSRSVPGSRVAGAKPPAAWLFS
jgi:hypothetical protein